MRVTKVTAHAFGPLAGESLEFAEGLTVVYGPNESAKSSWHSALTAALCGLKGGPKTGEDREFEARHRPWDRPGWEVSAEVLLADGRRVELRQDLSGGVSCYAKDLVLGTDYSNEIIGPGHHEVPDASRWLGLDRRAFRATASVSQAQLAAVAEERQALQEHVQRAAATAGADETAAGALARLATFSKEFVGGPTATTKPFRRATDEVTAAERALDLARDAHAEYEQRSVSVRQLRAAADAARHQVRVREAELARATASTTQTRATEATELTRLLAAPTAPDDDTDPSVLAEVSAALAAWRSVPTSPGPTVTPTTSNVDDDELRELARVLDRPAAPTGPPVDAQPAATRLATLRRGRTRARLLAVLGLVLLVGATAAAGLGPMAAAIGLGGLGVVLLAVGLLSSGGPVRGGAALTAATTELERVRVEQATQDRLLGAARAETEAALARCGALGLPPEAAVLRALASSRAGQDRDEAWRREIAGHRDRVGAQLLVAAASVKLPAGTAESSESTVDDVAVRLGEWLTAEPERAARRGQRHDWRLRLNHLLSGVTLEQLRAEAESAAGRADLATEAATVTDPELRQGGGPDSARDGAADPAVLRRVYDEAAQAAAAADAALAAWSQTLTPVAEAEERAAAAAAEVARVRDLDRILGLTHGFLTHAQDRVHRDIAPRLAQAVGRDLASVTAGRYTEVIVNPGSLDVQVRGPGGPLRDAGRLSFGTTEQVYLLLRVALAEHLVRAGESCPLLLDDVTVHADRERTSQILDLLLGVAERHQVVLFSQQEQVRDWATHHLRGPRHALRELVPVAAV